MVKYIYLIYCQKIKERYQITLFPVKLNKFKQKLIQLFYDQLSARAVLKLVIVFAKMQNAEIVAIFFR